MDTAQLFSRATAPDASRSAEALAAWSRDQDPLGIVLPLSVAAGWAYSDPVTFDEVMCRRGLRTREAKLVAMSNDAMFVCAKAYVQPVGSGAIVAFRGTEPSNLINWLADATLQKAAFHAKPPNAPRGYVHGGFYRNTRALWPKVVDVLDELKPEWMFFTGHSFGGALAVLSAALLADYAEQHHPRGYGALWTKLKGVFTFGQPMVGDEVFAASFDASLGERLVRFVYAHDIVPHLPPKTGGWAPANLGVEYRAPDATKWIRQAGAAGPLVDLLGGNMLAIAAWIKDQIGLAPKLALPYSWGDHAPNNYVRVSLPHGADSGSEFD